MRTTRKRCKHCGIEYSYQLSGNWDYKYNDEHYCPDCKKVMLEALENVPKKFTYGWKEIPFNISEKMKNVKQKKLSFLAECKNKNIPVIKKVYSVFFNSKISKTEYFVIDNIKYLIQYFYNGEKKMFMWCEKNIDNDEYGKYWVVNETDLYDVNENFRKETFDITSQHLEQPSNKIFFMQPYNNKNNN